MSLGPYVLALDDPAATDPLVSGGKGAGLARLCRLGVPVPDGVVVSTVAYREVAAALDGRAPQERARALAAVELPAALRDEIVAACRRLGATKVAVRSSGTAEDLEASSFAGQHDTFLDVEGEDRIVDGVRRCWASLWSDRAVDYRRRRGWDDTGLAMAVVVQAMVPAEWAGVLFTIDPVTGNRSHLVVEAVRGLGEALVSGEAAGERWQIDRASGEASGGGSLPGPVLADLRRLALRVEDAFGEPQDVEWAFAGGRTWLLQARPLTAAAPPAAERQTPGSLARSFAPTAIDHVPVTPLPFDTSLFFGPLFAKILAAARSVGIGLPATERVLVEIAEGVVQVVPPAPRPTRRLVRLPAALVRALGADMDAWLEDAERRVVRRSLEIDGQLLDGLSDSDLLERIRELQALLLEFATTRLTPLARGAIAAGAFGRLLRATAGRAAPDLERRLLADLACTTGEANREIARLAARVRGGGLAAVVEGTEPTDLHERLSQTDEGRDLVAAVDAYLARFGLRETILPSAGFPAWRDDPSLVYGLLKGLVRGETAAHREGEADRARGDLARRLERGRGPRRLLLPALLRLLDGTRSFLAFREESHYRAFLPFPVVRRLALEVGRRLVERGALGAPDDVFYLRLDELEAADEAGLGSLVSVRRAARKAAPSLCIVPPELMEGAAAAEGIVGVPVSGGSATGRVRIVRSEADFSRLQPGDVLVAPYTNPTWTPLFAIAAAVVVDGGGAASHAAIVAREYGVPAVMGTLVGTTRLHDGEQVLVDGSRGRVTRIGGGEL